METLEIQRLKTELKLKTQAPNWTDRPELRIALELPPILHGDPKAPAGWAHGRKGLVVTLNEAF